MKTENILEYEPFREQLIKGLEEHYGGRAEITVQKVLRANGERYEGLLAAFGTGEENIPVMRLDELYRMYRDGETDLDGCVGFARRFREEHGRSERMAAFSKVIRSWEYGKRNVYPLLLSTEENRELLGELAHTPVPGLDLSAAYLIREEGDGYAFRCLGSLIGEMMEQTGLDTVPGLEEEMEGVEMYVLTNRTGSYGAAGLLERETVREFAKGRNYYILPSSLHETIWVPAEQCERKQLDEMVREINEEQVDREEWLSCHSYFYDGERDEIRMTE